MRTLTITLKRLGHSIKTFAMGCALAAMSMTGASGSTVAECYWIVQRHLDGAEAVLEQTLVHVVFDGLPGRKQFFYGFTVTDEDLAWDLTTYGTLTGLGQNGRALMALETKTGTAFALSPESIRPHAVYLVAAQAPVAELEAIDAAIEPSQPVSVGQAKTRGGTDFSGALPDRSLPGFELRALSQDPDVDRWLNLLERDMAADQEALEHGEEGDEGKREPSLALKEADSVVEGRDKDGIRYDVQICAYQVTMR